jgi:hypothetical protein
VSPPKAHSVSQHSDAKFAVIFVRSILSRSPLLVDIELVGSDGVRLTSKAIVNALLMSSSLLIFGAPGIAFWNM